jgi:hypothetical protein
MKLSEKILAVRLRSVTSDGDESHNDAYRQGALTAFTLASELAAEHEGVVERMAEALDQALMSMQDSGYRNNSVVVVFGRNALTEYRRMQK